MAVQWLQHPSQTSWDDEVPNAGTRHFFQHIGYQMQWCCIGKERIGRHLGNMMGGTIAVITAVLVVNVNIEPVWIWWVLPTALITPVIIWWKIKVMK